MKEYENKVKIEYVELTDLSSVIRVINKHRPDVISHLAAQSWVPYSMDNPIYTMKTNVESTLNVMEAVRLIQELDNKFVNTLSLDLYNPLIHICSSSEYYGKVKREDLPITENHPVNPGNQYAIGKVGADVSGQFYNKYYDLKVIVTRMFTHCGIRRTMMSAENYYAKYIAEIEKGAEPIIPIGNMESIRTWADVRDAVIAYYKLFKKGKPGVYNIAGETVKSIREVLDYLKSISTYKGEIEEYEDPKLMRKVDVDKQVVDISKFKNEIQWEAIISFEQLMFDLLNYWRAKC